MFQVVLGPNKVLMAHGCPLTRAALIQRGLEVVEVSITPIFSQKQQVEYALFSRLIFILKVSDHALSGGHIRIHQAGRLRHVLECARAGRVIRTQSCAR